MNALFGGMLPRIFFDFFLEMQKNSLYFVTFIAGIPSLNNNR